MNRHDVIRSTTQHIRKVGELLVEQANDLCKRAVNHDASKWSEEEWPSFEETTPKLAGLSYGSPEYREALKDIKPALKHHYSINSHHPEYHQNGINDMTLNELIELLCDWKAASERHINGSVKKSLEFNKERFGIDSQLYRILENTARTNNWIE